MMNRVNQKKFEELVNTVSDIYGLQNITYETIINHHKTVSEDNDQFINILISKYNVDMTNFKYYDFFDEDEFIVVSVFNLILSFIGIKKKEKKKITIKHLLNVIDKGKWFEAI